MLFTSLLILAGAIGQNVTVGGRIVDRQDRPLHGAVVWSTRDEGATVEATTDAGGRFTIDQVDHDAPFIFVRHPGYAFTGQQLSRDATNLSIVLSMRDEAAAEPPLVHVERSREDRSAAARRFLLLAWPKFDALDDLDGYNGDDMRREVLIKLAGYDSEAALERLPQIKNPRNRLGPLIELGKFDDAVEAAMIFRSPEGRGFGLREVAEKHPDPARRRELLGQAAGEFRAILEADQRVWALGTIARMLQNAGDTDAAQRLIKEITRAADDLPLTSYRTAFAANLGLIDTAKALRLCVGASERDRDEAYLSIARHLADHDPQQAEEVFGRISKARQVDWATIAAMPIAKRDLKRARRLVDKVYRDRPERRADAYGSLAVAVKNDRDAAHKLLLDAIDLLDPEMRAPGRHDYFAWVAALVHNAELADPPLVRECLLHAVAFARAPQAKSDKMEQSAGKKNENPLRNALLAVLLDRYGVYPDVAGRLVEPLFDAEPPHVPREELTTRCFAMATVDSERAAKWLDKYLAGATPEQLRAAFPEPWAMMTDAAAGDDKTFWLTFTARVLVQ